MVVWVVGKAPAWASSAGVKVSSSLASYVPISVHRSQHPTPSSNPGLAGTGWVSVRGMHTLLNHVQSNANPPPCHPSLAPAGR